MLPLDVVNAEGIFRPAAWFLQALSMLASSGVHGVAVDVWWGAVEREPRDYNWAGYKQLFQLVRDTGLKLQVVMSFHACGGNVGDVAQIPLPDWVLQAGQQDPDLFFTDRPRESGLGQRNKEYISVWADEAHGVLAGRSPLQCYRDFMAAFRDTFRAELGSLIEEVVVGTGPCGELRYPSYVEANGWRFPGVGEFQCYDRRALASLAQAAREAGHPEWGYAGPHDSGSYNSSPEDTGFFAGRGSWDSEYGRFFLEWYSGCLLQHGERLLSSANDVFGPHLAAQNGADIWGRLSGGPAASFNILQSAGNLLVAFLRGGSNSAATLETCSVQPVSDCGDGEASDLSLCTSGEATAMLMSSSRHAGLASSRFGFSSSTLADSADCVNTLVRLDPCNSASSLSTDGALPSGFAAMESPEDSDTGMSSPGGSDEMYLGRACGAVADDSAAVRRSASGGMTSSCQGSGGSGGLSLTLKIAGIHWWYRSKSHAAELTAGYYNTDTRDGYRALIELCAKYRANLTLTCVEMCDAQHPPGAFCGPEGLLQQIRANATKHNVALSGENALPIFSLEGVDTVALERIVANTRSWAGRNALLASAPHSASAPTLGNIVSTGRSLGGRSVLGGAVREASVPRSTEPGDSPEPVPAMKSFTFLRLGPEILKPIYQAQWFRFLHKMHNGGY